MIDSSEYTPREKVALVVWAMAHDQVMTTIQVAALTGLSRQGAWDLMAAIARVIPIYQREDDGVWEVCDCKELD